MKKMVKVISSFQYIAKFKCSVKKGQNIFAQRSVCSLQVLFNLYVNVPTVFPAHFPWVVWSK